MSIYNKEILDGHIYEPSSLDKYIEWESQIVKTTSSQIDDIVIVNMDSFNYHALEDPKRIVQEIKKIVIHLHIDSKCYITSLNTQILHQLCTRMWRRIRVSNNGKEEYKYVDLSSDVYPRSEELELADIYRLFMRFIKNQNFESIFKRYIKDIFLKFNLTILFFQHKEDNTLNKIYGIVSSSYKILNQNDFRNTFLEKCRDSNLSLNLDSAKQFKHKYHESIYEFINTNHTFLNDNVKCSFIIEYGKNNGYRSYHFHWLISIINIDEDICIIKSKYNWRNNPHQIAKGFDYNQFINNIVEEGRLVLDAITIQITKLKLDTLNNKNQKANLLLEQIKIAKATQERIYTLWDEDSDNSNLWDFVKCLVVFSNNSQTIISSKMQRLIKRSALEILDNGFDVLKKWGKDGSRYIERQL